MTSGLRLLALLTFSVTLFLGALHNDVDRLCEENKEAQVSLRIEAYCQFTREYFHRLLPVND
jgi:hypothetical protein